METVALDDIGGIRPRSGYDAWDADGRFRFRTLYQNSVFQRRPAFFRVNSTGKVYRLVSRWKTVEVRAAGRRSGGTAALTAPGAAR